MLLCCHCDLANILGGNSDQHMKKREPDVQKMPIAAGYDFPWKVTLWAKGKKQMIASSAGIDWRKTRNKDKRLCLGLLACILSACRFPNPVEQISASPPQRCGMVGLE